MARASAKVKAGDFPRSRSFAARPKPKGINSKTFRKTSKRPTVFSLLPKRKAEPPPATAAWKSKPSWYVVAKNDRMISPQFEEAMAKQIKAKSITVTSSHLAMLAKPVEVADFIANAALNIAASPSTLQ